MELRRWKVINQTSGTLELGFRREPLGVGEALVISGELPERLRYYQGERKVSVKELPVEKPAITASEVVSSEGERKTKRNKSLNSEN